MPKNKKTYLKKEASTKKESFVSDKKLNGPNRPAE